MIGDVTGVINAGGRGVRLGGVRKALIEDGRGLTLLERTTGVLQRLFPRILLVANEQAPYERFGLEIVSDLIPDRGAPAGLHAALSKAATPWVFFVACDMPALDERVIDALASRRGDSQAVLPIVEGRAEPLHAFWSIATLPVLDKLLREGEPSFRDLAGAVDTVRVPAEALGPSAAASFANVNLPEDLARFGLRLPSSPRE